ncbi:MAG: DUF3224 domain-containing protein [Chloroflexota bacterium]|nr:DUF3224 domain-containing protein [Chloroflexota bacterium]
MAGTAKGIFEIADWDEKTYLELDGGGKLTEAKVTQKFTGDLVGEGSVIWLMAYTSKETARFVGIQRIAATLAGKKGSFLVETVGDFDGKVAEGDWTVIPESGTGDLAGISGEGSFGAPHGSRAEYELDYELASAPARH